MWWYRTKWFNHVHNPKWLLYKNAFKQFTIFLTNASEKLLISWTPNPNYTRMILKFYKSQFRDTGIQFYVNWYIVLQIRLNPSLLYYYFHLEKGLSLKRLHQAYQSTIPSKHVNKTAYKVTWLLFPLLKDFLGFVCEFSFDFIHFLPDLNFFS